MVTHQTFAEQSKHYFGRPSVGSRVEPVDHPAAWRGEDLRGQPGRWLVSLDDADIADLEAAASAIIASGAPLSAITSADHALPRLTERIDAWRNELRSGLGIVCLRGLPVRDWGEPLASAAYWLLGHHLGEPGAQNAVGELLGHVTDYGEADEPGMVRMYRTAEEIGFHCDAADVVGLLCLRTAREGGQSRIASSVTVFNEICRRRPDLAPTLFEPFHVDRRDEQAPGEPTTFLLPPCAWDGASLRTFWHSPYIRSAERHPGVDLTRRQREVVDLYDEITADPTIHLDMWLGEGDIQLISNHSVVHARTEYVDRDDPAERRHLLRLWLSLD